MQAYEAAVQVLQLHGLGNQSFDAAGEAIFAKHRLQQLSLAAREFLASLRVPSWFFDLMVDREWNATHAPILDKRADGDADERGESEQGPDAAPRKGEGVAASKRKLTQSDSTQDAKVPMQSEKMRPARRAYNVTLFDGTPPCPVPNSQSLCACINSILAKTLYGSRSVQFKPQERVNCICVAGTCSKDTCRNCSWRLMAWLETKSDGTLWLTVKCDGQHGERVRGQGKKVWAPAEAAAIKAAFPNQALLSSAGVRACLAAAGLDAPPSKEVLKQYVTRENRKRRGSRQARQKPLVQELLESVQAWRQKQTEKLLEGPLEELRVLGKPSCAVGHAFFAWTCRGFLNHAKNPEKQLLCLVVDGKHKVISTGAVIATLSILSKSTTPSNTSAARQTRGRIQMPLRTGTTRPVLQAYMDTESTPNFIRFFEEFCSTVKLECGYDPRPLVVQVQCDFSDAIEAARRQVFPSSRVVRDFPHLMRAAYPKLTSKTTVELRDRTMNFFRATRHLPTLELFSASCRAFLRELEAAKATSAKEYLLREYIHCPKKEIVRKFYGLRETMLSDLTDDVLWADFWCGALGTHPGSGTGSQTVEGFHSFWQSFLSKKARMHPCNVLSQMQGMFNEHWAAYMQEDDDPSPSLFPRTSEPAFLNDLDLHRLGQNSAAEYWAQRDSSNYKCLSRGQTKFWVMRCQATAEGPPALASVSDATATNLVDMLHMSETEVTQVFRESGILSENAAGEVHLSMSRLTSLFGDHCIVCEGDLPAQYCPIIFSRGAGKGRCVCTCSTAVQRAECPHIYFVSALQGEIDMNLVPEKRRPGRPKQSARKKPKESAEDTARRV